MRKDETSNFNESSGLNELREKLEPLDSALTLPDELSGDSIKEKLLASGSARIQALAKRRRRTYLRAVSVAAAFAIIIGGGYGIKDYITYGKSYVKNWTVAEPRHKESGSGLITVSTQKTPDETKKNPGETRVALATSCGDSTTAENNETAPNEAQVTQLAAQPPLTERSLPKNVSKPSNYQELEKRFKEMKASKDSFSLNDMLGGLLSAKGNGSEGDLAESARSSEIPKTDGGAEYGKTNTQVADVDEADIIKNDGTYIYSAYTKYEEIRQADNTTETTAANSAGNGSSAAKSVAPDSGYYDGYSGYYITVYTPSIRIIKAVPGNELSEQALLQITDLPAVDAYPDYKLSSRRMNEIYVRGDSLYAILTEVFVSNGDNYYSTKEITTLVIYDIADRTAPALIKTFSQDGSYLSSRLTGDRLIMMTNHNVSLYGTPEELADTSVPGVIENSVAKKIAVDDILLLEDKTAQNYLIVSNINTADLDASPEYCSILGGGQDSYCTADTLYVSHPVNDNKGLGDFIRDGLMLDIAFFSSSTEIFSFDITTGTVFTGSGKVPGTPLNQFSMDEYKDYFRIATTENKQDGRENNVFVLDKEFKIVGALTGLAKNESIQSCRFMGDTCYLVTFERTDPLFVIDMTDPLLPKVTGELKIPGFSTYLHPVGENLLAGVGVTGDERGQTNGVKISLFDVSDPAAPKEVDKLEIMNAHILEISHKAFLSMSSKNRYGLIIEQYEYDKEYYNTYTNETNLVTFDVKDGKLTKSGAYSFADRSYDHNYYYGYAQRGTYISDTIYTVMSGAVKAYDMNSGELLSQLG